MNVCAVAVVLLSGASLLAQTSDTLARAEKLYGNTDYRTSLAVLYENGASSGAAYALIGKDEYMLGDYKKATEAFEHALALEPSSEHALWLARSYGRRAETSSPFSAPRYASKARGYFEKAVTLDPQNEEALNDLFDYYLEAPGFLGGGYDKAAAVAKRIEDQDPAEGQFAQAQLANQRKQFDTAEEHLRQAVALAPREVGRLLDLARYLAQHGRTAESEAAFDRAARLAPNSPKVTFTRAQTYVQQKRNLEEAKALLRQYLQSNLTPDDPSREQAEQLLKEASGA